TGVALGCEEAASHGIKSGGVSAGAPSRAQNEEGQEAAKAKLDTVRSEHKAAKAAEKAEAKAAAKSGAPTAAKSTKPDKDKKGPDAGAKGTAKKPPSSGKSASGKLGPASAPSSKPTK